MNKKTTEKKPRTKRPNPLSASSETTADPNNRIRLIDQIHFYEQFKCKNKTQKDLLNLINQLPIIFASGPAGVGKSYVVIARALELLKANNTSYTKIIISKPAIESEEKHGFIPGDVREKMEPYISSSLDIFDKLIGKTNRLKLEENGYLEVQPLAYIRGKSIDNTILVMEEAQNMSPMQMKTLLTRIGENSKFIISGDLDQSDRYKFINQSGLYDAIQKHQNTEGIGFVEFNEDEIVRNPIISRILKNYKKAEPIVKKVVPKKKSKNILARIINFFK